MKKGVKRIALFCMFCILAFSGLRAQDNQPQLRGIYSKNYKGAAGFCDSVVGEFLSATGKWRLAVIGAADLNSKGYIDVVRNYDSAPTPQYYYLFIRDSADKIIREEEWYNKATSGPGTGFVKSFYIVADTNSSGQIIREHTYQRNDFGSSVTYPEYERYLYTYDAKGNMLGRRNVNMIS